MVSQDEDGYKGIEHSKLTAVLVEAIKALCRTQGGWAVELDSSRGGPAFFLLETVPKLSLFCP